MLSNKSLKSVIGIGGVLIVVLIIGIIFLLVQKLKYTVYDTDMVIEGDWVVASGEPVKLRNNAKITVKGDAIFEDEIICEDGGLTIEVEGNLMGRDLLECDSDPEELGAENAGVNLVLKGNAIFNRDSKIVSTGSVQFVDDASKLMTTQDQINAKHENLDELEGVGIGPLEEEGEDLTRVSAEPSFASTLQQLFVETAHAQADPLADFQIDAAKLEEALIEALVDEMRQYISQEKPDDAEIRQMVKDLADRLGIESGPNELGIDLSAILNIDLYRILTEAPNPEELTRWFFERALKQGETVVIVEGEIVIGDGGRPPFDIDVSDDFKREGKKQEKPKRIVLNYDFSDGKGLALQNITITGLDGVHYGGVTAPDCTYKGNDGGDAMRFTGRAGRMRIGNLTLNNGNGGVGETVVSPRGCEESKMTGGEGGKPGNIKLVASREFVIDGSVFIVPGRGGQGGGARAVTHMSRSATCPAESRKAAEATGGDGGDSKQRLRTSGTVVGIGNVQIDPAFGGNGGPAIADSFDVLPIDGETCGCKGGNGAPAIAKGGNGGDASRTDGSKGGDGGTATAYAGAGGNGGSCGVNEGPGGAGGNGGNASATPGKGGNGNQQGADGQIVEEQAGDAGNGGHGCTEGKAGSIGQGQIPGLEGDDGDNTCKGEEKKKEYFISVISYNGLLIPVFQTNEADPDACPSRHRHARGPVKALSGEIVNDPKPDECGFGTVDQLIPFDEAVNGDDIMEIFGPSITEHLRPASGESDDGQGRMIQIDPPRTVIPIR